VQQDQRKSGRARFRIRFRVRLDGRSRHRAICLPSDAQVLSAVHALVRQLKADARERRAVKMRQAEAAKADDARFRSDTEAEWLLLEPYLTGGRRFRMCRKREYFECRRRDPRLSLTIALNPGSAWFRGPRLGRPQKRLVF